MEWTAYIHTYEMSYSLRSLTDTSWISLPLFFPQQLNMSKSQSRQFTSDPSRAPVRLSFHSFFKQTKRFQPALTFHSSMPVVD
jgi:hypothetical protein